MIKKTKFRSEHERKLIKVILIASIFSIFSCSEYRKSFSKVSENQVYYYIDDNTIGHAVLYDIFKIYINQEENTGKLQSLILIKQGYDFHDTLEVLEKNLINKNRSYKIEFTYVKTVRFKKDTITKKFKLPKCRDLDTLRYGVRYSFKEF